jgi:hypothetical protein
MSLPRPTLRWLTYFIPILFGTGVSLVLFNLASDRDLWTSWSAWLPYGFWPVFHDLDVTLQHLREAAAGGDPLGDPKSEFAYPRAVLALHHLGIQYVPSEWLGLAQSIVVVIGVVLVLRPSTVLGATLTSLLFLTPPILLGFERANLDFPLFLLCAASATVWARSRTMRTLSIAVGGLMLAALLKLHPVFAVIGAVFADSGRRRLMWLTGLALLLAYWCINRADLGLIAQKVPVWTWGSWGCLLFFVRLERFFELDREAYVWLANAKWPLIALITYGISAVVAFGVGIRFSGAFASVRWPRRECAYFWVGAAMCCGSFAGANIAYRWIFVLLSIPLLLRGINVADRSVAMWSRLTLAAVSFSLLAPLHANRGMFLLVQFANWSCILLLIVGCAALRYAPRSGRVAVEPIPPVRPERLRDLKASKVERQPADV